MKKLILNIVLVLAFGYFSNAQVDRSVMPKASTAPVVKIGNFKSFVTENGMKVFVVENHKLPVVSVSIVLDVDPVLEKQTAGYVSIAGDLISTGTKTRTKAQLDEEIDYIGASLTTSSQGAYASALKKHQEKMFELLSDVVMNPSFSPDEFNKIIKQTLSGLVANKTEPSAIANNVMTKVLFGDNHPYGEFETEESVKAITLDQCIGYYNTYFHPNVAYMAVVGDITYDEAVALVNKYFSKWQKAEVPKNTYATPTVPNGNRVCLVDRPEAVQSVVNIAFPVKLVPGTPDVIPAMVMNTILGSTSFRLFNNLRETHGWTYGSYSALSPDKLIGDFDASADVRTSVTDSAVEQILYEITRMTTEKVTDKELEMAKNYFNGNFALSLENPQTIARFALNLERYGMPKDYYETYMAKVSALTADDILNIAKQVLKPSNCYIIVVGNTSEFAGKLKRFSGSGKVYYYDVNGKEYDPALAIKPAPAGVTAKTVIDDYYKAIGGFEKYKKIKSITTLSTAPVQGMTLKIKTISMWPDKFYMELGNDKMTFQKQIFDGTKGAMIAQGKTNLLEGDELTEMKIESNMLKEINYEVLGVKTKLLGIETLEGGKDAYKIELTLPTGRVKYEYYDVTSFLKVKESSIIESPQGKFQQVTFYSDYTDVKGLLFPFTVKQLVGPQELNFKVTSIELNKVKDTKIFTIE